MMHDAPDSTTKAAAQTEAAHSKRSFSDMLHFIRRWASNPQRTGAVAPSSSFLARKMVSYIDRQMQGPILELGPGTGPVTHALLEHGIDAGRLTLIEYDDNFCGLLTQRYPKAHIIQGDAYNLPKALEGMEGIQFDAVISSLPLLLVDEARRVQLLNDAFNMMGKNGLFVQFTYGLKSPIPLQKLKEQCQFSATRSSPVLRNVPPAHVWVYRRQV